MVGSIGTAYSQYREIFIDNKVDGNMLYTLDNSSVLELFNRLNISNGLHQWKLREKLNELRQLRGTPGPGNVKAHRSNSMCTTSTDNIDNMLKPIEVVSVKIPPIKKSNGNDRYDNKFLRGFYGVIVVFVRGFTVLLLYL